MVNTMKTKTNIAGLYSLPRSVKVFVAVVAAVCVVVLGLIYWMLFLRPYESTDDAFIDARYYALSPKVSGYIERLFVTDNQHVKKDDVLFQIDQRDYRIALAQAKSNVQIAEAAVNKIASQVEAQRATVEASKAEVAGNDAKLQFTLKDARRYNDLAIKGAGTVKQSQQSVSNRDQSQAALDASKAKLLAEIAQLKGLEADVMRSRASLVQAQETARKAQLDLNDTIVRAFQDGRVARVSSNRGQYVQAGQSLAVFVPDDLWVTANFKETQLKHMRIGQEVSIRIDAHPDYRIKGFVDSIQPGSGTVFSLLPAQNATGNYVKVVQRVPVKIVVQHWPSIDLIGPGMSVVPKVKVR